MKVLVFFLLFVLCCSVSGQNFQLRNYEFKNQSAGAFNQHQTPRLMNYDSIGFDLSNKFSVAAEYLYIQPNKFEFSWLIRPQYYINNKNSVSISLGYFPNTENGHLFGGYISDSSSYFPSVFSVTKSGSAVFAMINHSTIFPVKLSNCLITFEIAKGFGLINLHNELMNSETENYLFFNSKVGLSANIYFHHFQFGIEPIELEFSLYKKLDLFTYRPSVYIGILFN